ncbi:quinone-dependent dihydroorotate dehydrogenase [Kutzneria buriramensis]|uniref:Dihydroorotate dehydrogenase (quinone) n=1 Tax=Kutzneria buriramensis TaxID=1045776 RepID=A0A3E0GZ89_9PSEU|nr:quinone-dependent dihydroorotate dehydrogenase [Kutzneria buriramensis]REH33116.1 dihydroorotate dehydrogenase (fumarate)/dihydroorotate dehydrogenase [Kutzneria buriramensis]
MYRRLLAPALFRAEPEWIHDRAIRLAERVGRVPAIASYCAPTDASLVTDVAGLRMATPIGLGAGFDKNARAVPALASLGFGHVEVGSIAARPSDGNPRPRLFRLPEDEAIVVYYGVPNEGADRVAQRLANRRRTATLGINIVNTNHGIDAPPSTEDEVIADYLTSTRILQPHADYLCLNLSCPNTHDGQGFFHQPHRLAMLIDGLREVGIEKPLLLKVAPFPDLRAMETFLQAVAPAEFVSGFSVNLPAGKPPGLRASAAELPGAVSGRPAAAAANRTIRELYRSIDPERHVIVGSGGVFTAEDAYAKIRLGASLVQLLTALVYRGPTVARAINRELPKLLRRDGFTRVADAVGTDARG